MRRAMETILATVLVPGVADVLVPYLLLSGTGASLPSRFGAIELLAILAVAAGAGLMIWVSYAFVAKGHGTPIPIDPPREFVTEGAFRFVRNPMYLGALLVLAGQALAFRSSRLLLYGLALWVVLHTFLITLEEPQLERRFGADYRVYLEQTPRWIPRPPRPEKPRRA